MQNVEKKLDKMRCHTDAVQRAQSDYLLNTYNHIEINGHATNVWHIHGEARNTKSIIIGHEHYGRLLSSYTSYLDDGLVERYQQEEGEVQIKSWIDLFLLHDVFMLGFGFHPAEMDLWYLLCRRKSLDFKKMGEIYYYYPKWEREETVETRKLLNVFDVTGKCLEMDKAEIDAKNYRSFYEKALEDIMCTESHEK